MESEENEAKEYRMTVRKKKVLEIKKGKTIPFSVDK
jgi:hypothetical protein